MEGVFQGHHFAMADVHVDTSLPPDAIRSFLDPDGMGFLFPMTGTRARIMFFVDARRPEGKNRPGNGSGRRPMTGWAGWSGCTIRTG